MPSRSASPEPPADAEAIEQIVALLRERRGVDFATYRRSTLARRIELQARTAGSPSADDYLTQLRVDDAEADRLIARLTIKVSGFFRGEAMFEALRQRLVERLSEHTPESPLRCWSAGCAQGEEAYSLAILLSETGQADSIAPVLATDMDAAALESSERGCYPGQALSGVRPDQLAAHFKPMPDGKRLAYHVTPALRESVRFVQHDLTSESAPVGGPFDVILCRNVLIYWSRAVQERIQSLLVAQLAPRGVLCLGEAEWPARCVAEQLETVDSRQRIFRLRAPPQERGT